MRGYQRGGDSFLGKYRTCYVKACRASFLWLCIEEMEGLLVSEGSDLRRDGLQG